MTDSSTPVYEIRKVLEPVGIGGAWDSPARRHANVLEVTHFMTDQSGHRPEARLKMLYDNDKIYGMFLVHDQYVGCTHTQYQSEVCMDASVAVFLEPKPGQGYFTLEMNCCGHFRAWYVEDPTPKNGGFKKCREIPWDHGHTLRVFGSMDGRVEPEIEEPATWHVEFSMPFAYFERYVGSLGDIPGQEWRGNFHKCAFGGSHPHGAAWAPLGPENNFHQPDQFGTIVFEP
mgnify:FL=1